MPKTNSVDRSLSSHPSAGPFGPLVGEARISPEQLETALAYIIASFVNLANCVGTAFHGQVPQRGARGGVV